MSTQASHSIAERAYLIWEQMGRPQGQALEHWLRAEAEVTANPATSASTPAAAASPKRARRKRT